MSKPTWEWGLIRQHKWLLAQKMSAHQSSSLVQSSDCRLPTRNTKGEPYKPDTIYQVLCWHWWKTSAYAAVFIPEKENRLWTNGALGVHSPTSLQNAVFYYNGKNFALRGIGEQYRLKVLQLVREYNPDRYVYKENGSKNRLALG